MDELALPYVAVSMVVLGGFFALLVVLRRTKFAPRPKPAPQTPRQKKLHLVLGGVVLTGFIGLAGTAALHVEERRAHFRELGAAKPALTLSRGDRRVELTDAAEISRFFTLVEQAPNVGAHHSHPMGEVELRLGDTTYTLGRDSSVAGELWLRQVQPRATWGDPTLWQLRSSALSEWFASVEARLK